MERSKINFIKNDPSLKAELEKLEPKYQVIRQLIEQRIMRKLTQKQLAEKIYDKQANIASVENGNMNPSIEKLAKIAEGFNADIEIRIIPRSV